MENKVDTENKIEAENTVDTENTDNTENKEKSRSKVFLEIFICGIILFLFSLGTSFFWYKLFQKDKVAFTNFVIALKDGGKGVDVTSAVPQEDKIGQTTPGYSFEISNNGEIPGNYEVILEDSIEKDEDGSSLENLLTREQLRYQLSLNDQVINKGYLSELEDSILDIRSINKKKTNVYNLKIWVAKNAVDWENKIYHYRVVVKPMERGK